MLDSDVAREAAPAPLLHRRAPASFWALTCLLVGGTVVAAMVGWREAPTFALLVVLAVPIGFLVIMLPSRVDAPWLANLVMLAWTAKIVASVARYWALQVLYSRVGDATRYHGAGRRLAAVWRTMTVPPFEPGTEFVEAVTGLLYVPHEPTKLGGFFIFATLAFVGQVLCYAAFRQAFPSGRLKWYAVLVFFFPNLIYWPASIGKESLMVLFIGVSAYAVVRLLGDYRLRWVPLFAAGVGGCGLIRSHIALALVLALLVAMLVSRSPTAAIGGRRLTLIIAVVMVLIVVGRLTIRDFGIDASAGINQALVDEVIDPVFTGVEEQTAQGGSEVEGRAVRSPADIPAAVLRVLFRPLPHEAHNAQALANSLIEGTLLLALVLWHGPAIVRNLPRLWRTPYVLFSLVYTAGFIYGHSAILNLGIMARQRSQMIPFVLVLLVAVGFGADRQTRVPATDSPQPIRA